MRSGIDVRNVDGVYREGITDSDLDGQRLVDIEENLGVVLAVVHEGVLDGARRSLDDPAHLRARDVNGDAARRGAHMGNRVGVQHFEELCLPQSRQGPGAKQLLKSPTAVLKHLPRRGRLRMPVECRRTNSSNAWSTTNDARTGTNC